MFRRYQTDKCYIIAEIGGNFTTYEEARELIDAAANCKVDAVKLQTYTADTLSSKKAMFNMENTGVVSQYELFRQYQIDVDTHKKIFKYAESRGLDWFSTPSHESDVDALESFNVGAHKIGSDDAVNLPFLRYVAKTGKPIFLSTGMSTLEEVKESVFAMQEAGVSTLILLHAITSYPTHAEHVNLNAMLTLMKEFPQIDVGYSDHTLTPVASLAAVAMGARVIERHFTYDKNADGPDHQLSADPEEMKWLVDAIREYEVMRGSGIKQPAESEKITRLNNRKSLVMKTSLIKGAQITGSDLAIKRPGTGIQPKHFDDVIGKTLLADIEEDDVLTWDHIQ